MKKFLMLMWGRGAEVGVWGTDEECVEELWDAGVKKSVMVARFDLAGVLGVSWLWVSSGRSEEKVACFSTKLPCSEFQNSS